MLPVEDLREMLKHIEEMLSSIMHLPISSEDALHFYRYLHTHILIADEQFLLLIDVPIQDCAQQMEIYEEFNLDIPHTNFSACYDIQNKYLGITRVKPAQFKYQKINSKHTKRPTDNFAYWTHHLYHLPTHQHVYQLCMPRTRTVSRKDVPHRARRPAVLANQHP